MSEFMFGFSTGILTAVVAVGLASVVGLEYWILFIVLVTVFWLDMVLWYRRRGKSQATNSS